MTTKTKTDQDAISKVAGIVAAARGFLPARIPGSFTAKEYAAQNNLSDRRARAVLNQLVVQGTLKVVKVPVLRSDGARLITTGYILVEDLENFQKSQQRKTRNKK